MPKRHPNRRNTARPPPQSVPSADSISSEVLSGPEGPLIKRINDLLKSFADGSTQGKVNEVDICLEEVASTMRDLGLSEAPSMKKRKDNLQDMSECLTELIDKIYPIGATTYEADGLTLKLFSQGFFKRLFDLVARRAQTFRNGTVLMKLVVLIAVLQRNAGGYITFCSESAVIDLARFCLVPDESRTLLPDKDDLVRIRAMTPFKVVDWKEWPEKQLLSTVGVWLLMFMCNATTPGDIELAQSTNMIASSDLLPVLMDLSIGDSAKEAPQLMKYGLNLMNYVLNSYTAHDCEKVTTDVIVRIVDKCVEFRGEFDGLELIRLAAFATKGCAGTKFLENRANWATFKKLLDLALSRDPIDNYSTFCVFSLCSLLDRCDDAVVEEARSQKMDDGELVIVRVANWLCKHYSVTPSDTILAHRMIVGLLLSYLCQNNRLNLKIATKAIENRTPAPIPERLAQTSKAVNEFNKSQRKKWALMSSKKPPCACNNLYSLAPKSALVELNKMTIGFKLEISNAFA